MANAAVGAASTAAGLAGGPIGIGFMLSMQAAGMVMDFQNTKNNMKLVTMGRQLEKAAIDSNLEAIRVESNQASLDEMVQLRQNLGSQIVNQAARGTQTGVGTAQTLSQSSVNNFNADEKTRRMNLLVKEANLRASDVLSGLHTLQSETQLGQAQTSRLFNTLPISSAYDRFSRTKLGKQWGLGMEPA